MENSNHLRKPDDKSAVKRPYQKPRLTVYGDLRRTLTKGGGSFADGGVHPANKTG
jgi:hypothetical protein